MADLVDALRASPDWIYGLSLVAEAAGRVVAHMLFTRGLLDAPRRLAPVPVLAPVGVVSGPGKVPGGIPIVGPSHVEMEGMG